MSKDTTLIRPASVRLTTWIEEDGSEKDQIQRSAAKTLAHVIEVKNRSMVPKNVRVKGVLADNGKHCEFPHSSKSLVVWDDELKGIPGSGERRTECEIRLKKASSGETPVQCPGIEWQDHWPGTKTWGQCWTGRGLPLEVKLKIL